AFLRKKAPPHRSGAALQPDHCEAAMPTESPTDAQGFFNRGLDRLKAGNWKEALADFDQAIRLRPDVSIGYRFRAYAHAAAADFTRAIQMDPEGAAGYLTWRGDLLLELEQGERAVADYTAALEKEPDNAAVYNARARAYWSLRRLDEAITDFTRALELDPD